MTGQLRQGSHEFDITWGQLMAMAQDGDRASYERLLREATPFIRRIARQQRITSDAVDEVMQDALLTLHRARHTYDPARSFSAWLATITRRRAIDVLRRQRRRSRRETHNPDAYQNHPDATAEGFENGTPAMQASFVAGAIEQLPVGQREAIEMLAIRQLSLDEASVMTGKTKGALKVNMQRALQSLRARFGVLTE